MDGVEAGKASQKTGPFLKLRHLLAAGVALCLAAYLIVRPGSAPAAVFATHVSGFEQALVADSHGRVVHHGAAQPQRLAADRWVAIDRQARASVWFDDSGHELRRGPYVEIRSEEFTRHPDDPDPGALFNTWSQQGMALLRADGSAFVDWQPGYGKWAATGHPRRYSWQPREGGERIFDARGELRMELDEMHFRAAGPFSAQALYLLCGYDAEQPCELRDEAGSVRWRALIDDLIELQDGRWLARRFNAWFVLDEQGQRVGDKVYAAGQYLPRSRSPASARTLEWPRWMTRYQLAAAGAEVLESTAVRGFLQHDGQFDPVPGASHAHQLCPGTWRLSGPGRDSHYWLSDSRGQRFAEHLDRGWNDLENHPGRYLANTTDQRDAIVDCRGTRLFDDPEVADLEPMGPGFAAQLKGEQQARLWLNADLQRQLLPAGSNIRGASPDGRLLLVAEDDRMRLYNTGRERFVGEPFEYAEAPWDQGLAFNRSGYYGFMDGDGEERLAPRHTEIKLWGEDRLWSRHDLDQGSELGLYRLDGSLIARWSDALATPVSTWQGERDTQAVAQVYGKTYRTEQGAYFPQQWVDRDGRTLMTSVQCPGADAKSVLANGPGRLEPASGQVLEEGGHCQMPAEIRSAIAAKGAAQP